MQTFTYLLGTPFARIEQGLEANARTASNSITHISPMTGGARAIIAQNLLDRYKHILLLFPDQKKVLETEVELTLLGLAGQVIAITNYTSNALQERLSEAVKSDRCIIVATFALFLAPLPAKQDFDSQLIKIETGSTVLYEELLEYLNLYNYQSGQFVEEPGSYSKRGAIIDFWPYSEKMPVRIEFDGDFIESIRSFDPESQRSIEVLKGTTLAPHLEQRPVSENEMFRIFDYLDHPLVVMNKNEAGQFEMPEEEAAVKKQEQAQQTGNFDEEKYDIPPDNPEKDAVVETHRYVPMLLERAYAAGKEVHWLIEEQLSASDDRIDLMLSDAPPVNAIYKVLFSVIKEYSGLGYTVFVASENDLQCSRLKALFDDPVNGIDGIYDAGKLKVIMLPVKDGFTNRNDKIVLFTDYQIFGKPFRTRLPSKLKKAVKKSRQLESIKPADFVVHEEFGIGQFYGLESITINDVEQESMKIRYADGGVVYVNINYLHLVKKFSAQEGVRPTLSALGSPEWANRKKKAKKKIKEAAKELIELYARRKMSRGFSFGNDTIWQQELEAAFMYEDTIDQSRVMEEVKADMQAANPMDRLVCGDVGFGKTEIAVRAAFKAVQDGKQVAILVPTTILAEQHYNTFTDRIAQFPVTVAALSRFQTKAEQKDIVEKLAQGKIDIVVGTHRILSKDVKFRDLGLLIIDEEHRFGVASKEKLRSYKANVDILTMTATPIPRTLNLSLLGARDLSMLSTPPANRQPVYTRVETFEQANVRGWIMSELKREGQVYIIHDRVQTIEKFAAYIQKKIPEAKIAIAHGQMKPQQLEDVFHGFQHRKFDILLATKIIESGVDIPNVNTIIINRADRFGLAELHQLRGRVGRAERQAYAYFLVPTLQGIQKQTLQRLQAVEEHTELGAGFQLAMRDLEIRGAGNLLGNEQTGFINEIGFDLYIKLINQSVEELKQEEFRELFQELPSSRQFPETTIEAYFEIGIPRGFIPDQMDRLSYYTAMFSVKSRDELQDISEEIKDRYGDMPALVKRLLLSAELRLYASRALFERVIIQPKRIIITLPKGNDEEFYQAKFRRLYDFIAGNHRKTIQFIQQGENLKLQINEHFNVPERAIEYLTGFAIEVADLYGLGPKADGSKQPQ